MRAYDIESLVGNAGGYIGLFMGYALFQLPNLFLLTFGAIKRMILERKTQNPARVSTKAIMVKDTDKKNKHFI